MAEVSLDALERDKYVRMWREAGYRKNSPAERACDRILEHARSLGVRSFVDFGCGTGRASFKLDHENMDCIAMVDIARNCLDPNVRDALGSRFICANIWEPLKPLADMVICCDVMEHIPPEHVPAVIENLQKYEHGYVQLANFMDGCGRMIGETLHLTVQPPEWWYEQFGYEGFPDSQRANTYFLW